MPLSVYLSLVVAVIIGMMFGWEIGFGVAFLVAGFGFLSAGHISWGIVLLIPGIGLAITSYLRIHSKVGVGIELSDFQGEYFQHTNIPSEYLFSGTIEVKVPSAVAVTFPPKTVTP